jgi:TrmH family RNA methyltransferase
VTSKAALKRLLRLKQKKHRERERLFLAEGPTLIEEAPEPPAHLLTEPDDVKKLSTLTTPTGPVAAFPFLHVSPEELLEGCDRIVLLCGVQDPGNVGTIIRSAHAFGAGVALAEGTADLYNPKTVRATMGSIFHAPISRELDVLAFLAMSRLAGFETAAAVPGGGEPMGSLPPEELIVVVGAEGQGLPEEVISACSRRITIPAQAPSLNAAVAASILLYEGYVRMLPLASNEGSRAHRKAP